MTATGTPVPMAEGSAVSEGPASGDGWADRGPAVQKGLEAPAGAVVVAVQGEARAPPGWRGPTRVSW